MTIDKLRRIHEAEAVRYLGLSRHRGVRLDQRAAYAAMSQQHEEAARVLRHPASLPDDVYRRTPRP